MWLHEVSFLSLLRDKVRNNSCQTESADLVLNKCWLNAERRFIFPYIGSYIIILYNEEKDEE